MGPHFETRSHAPVEVTRLDVAESFWLTAAEQDQIGGEEVVGFEPNDVANLDAPPWLVLELRADEHLRFP